MGDPKAEGPARRRSPEPTHTAAGPQRASEESPAETPDFIGEYRVLGKLGEGGMAVVFEAEQQHPRRKVALKVIRGDIFLDEHQIRMFQREASPSASLDLPVAPIVTWSTAPLLFLLSFEIAVELLYLVERDWN